MPVFEGRSLKVRRRRRFGRAFLPTQSKGAEFKLEVIELFFRDEFDQFLDLCKARICARFVIDDCLRGSLISRTGGLARAVCRCGRGFILRHKVKAPAGRRPARLRLSAKCTRDGFSTIYFFFPACFSSLSSTAFFSSLPTNSIRAISAPSPLRGPSLKILVYPPGRSAKRSASSPVNFLTAATPAVASAGGLPR